MIKDYTENMSKKWRKKLEKPDRNRQTVVKIHTITQQNYINQLLNSTTMD